MATPPLCSLDINSQEVKTRCHRSCRDIKVTHTFLYYCRIRWYYSAITLQSLTMSNSGPATGKGALQPADQRRIFINAFEMFTPNHLSFGQWRRKEDRSSTKRRDLSYWKIWRRYSSVVTLRPLLSPIPTGSTMCTKVAPSLRFAELSNIPWEIPQW